MRNRPTLGTGTRPGSECSDLVELARRMNIPAAVAIHEFMDLGTRSRPGDREQAPRTGVAFAAADR